MTDPIKGFDCPSMDDMFPHYSPDEMEIIMFFTEEAQQEFERWLERRRLNMIRRGEIKP